MSSFAKTAQDLGRITAQISLTVDVTRSFPDWPFRDAGHVALYEFDTLLSGDFGETLGLLAKVYGDEEVLVASTIPESNAFAEENGYYPAFKISSDDVAADFWPTINWSPAGRGITAFLFSAHSFAAVGTSGRWAVFGQRDWELGLLLTPDGDGPWRHSGAPWSSKDVDIATLRSPVGWGMPISPLDGKKFLDNLMRFGSGT